MARRGVAGLLDGLLANVALQLALPSLYAVLARSLLRGIRRPVIVVDGTGGGSPAFYILTAAPCFHERALALYSRNFMLWQERSRRILESAGSRNISRPKQSPMRLVARRCSLQVDISSRVLLLVAALATVVLHMVELAARRRKLAACTSWCLARFCAKPSQTLQQLHAQRALP